MHYIDKFQKCKIRIFILGIFNYEIRKEVNLRIMFSLQFAGDQFALTCAQFIPRLIDVIQAPKSREPENVNPTENAISAITKILKYNSSIIPNVDEIILLW